MELTAYIKQQSQRVNTTLQHYMDFNPAPFDLLAESMAYSLFAGGKRIRPILCLAGTEVVGGKSEAALPFACALEMIHTYSLVHDDLPVMDDDDLRRGRPTNHTKYGEAQALLAGNALLTLAFQICLEAAEKGVVPHRTAVEVLSEFTRSIGVMGVMGGQSLDILWEGRELTLENVETVCHNKTATLIATSIQSGAMVGNATADQLASLMDYGQAIGLAFQVADDILNVSGDAAKLGKSTGTDQAKGKTTYAGLLGLEGAKAMAEDLLTRALGALEFFGPEAWMLREIARYIVHRDR